MRVKRMSINPAEYVVFDVETNGLSSKRDDLLLISFYKPDDGKCYSKYLPMEMNRSVKTTRINGIKEKDLEGAVALSQEEFNRVAEDFELYKRTVLIYSGGNFDERFLKEYMKRHKLTGYERINYYNIKHSIISSRFSQGNITKDHMCQAFGIDGVTAVHHSENDCRLEWLLFEKMQGYRYLIKQREGKDCIYRLKDEYIIPAGLFWSHPNLRRAFVGVPSVKCQSTVTKVFEISGGGIEHLPTNMSGMMVEHLFNTMLNVDMCDCRDFLTSNYKRLEYVGDIPNSMHFVAAEFKEDGLISVAAEKDKEYEKRANEANRLFAERVKPIVDYIREDIFGGKRIRSQELVVNSEYNVLALCDLSTDEAILEIKTDSTSAFAYKEQFYFEANGRKIYHLKMDWVKDPMRDVFAKIRFIIENVQVELDVQGDDKGNNEDYYDDF